MPTETEGFRLASWLVVAAYMLATTWMGHRLSRRKQTIRDFFLGGRRLPWYAVSGSIVATELSAMTLVGAPAFLWAETGDLSYGILSIGAVLARLIVAWLFIPRFYEEEIYSPYEYIGRRLGARAERVTSLLFMAGGILGQGTRVLLTAIVLEVVSGIDVLTAIWLVGLAAVVWTWMGGIVTVIWTDVVQFCVLAFSALLTLGLVWGHFGGAGEAAEVWRLASEAGKLRWFDASLDPRLSYTLWTALIANTIFCLAAYGTDQMMAQRYFCCRDLREARKAVIWSSLGQLLTWTCLFAGVALWAFYRHGGVALPGELAQIDADANRLLPVFVRYRVPWLLGGLVVAGIFAAAISSLDSILAALAQQTLAWTGRDGDDDARRLRRSRFYIVAWAVALCGMASLFHLGAGRATLLIELALSVVGLVSGAILGIFLMALVPALRRRARGGLEWTAALSVMNVFAIANHKPWAPWLLLAAALAVTATAFLYLMPRRPWAPAKLLPFLALAFALNLTRLPGPDGPTPLTLGWPWFASLGAAVLIAAGLWLCPRLQGEPE